jgi:hypothetical protein
LGLMHPCRWRRILRLMAILLLPVTSIVARNFCNVPNPTAGSCSMRIVAIVVYGEGAGSTRAVCTDPDCPIHRPSRVIQGDPRNFHVAVLSCPGNLTSRWIMRAGVSLPTK